MGRLHIVSHPDYDARFSPVHRFPMGKYTLLMTELKRLGLLDEADRHRPGEAPAGWLALAHAQSYVDQVLACQVPAPIEREIGFAVDERVARRTRLACSGSVMTGRLALEHGIACNAAGGSHHARREQGAGFCVFNDVAVAASVLRATGEAQRILVVDCDVHQGDGTASIFADETDVFTFSIHAEKNYPVRKVPSDFDIGLPAGLRDEAYLETVEWALSEIEGRFTPDLVFYIAGVDPHFEDRLGHLDLTDSGLIARDHLVFRHFRERSIPVASVLGGGYSRDMASLGRRHGLVFRAARDYA